MKRGNINYATGHSRFPCYILPVVIVIAAIFLLVAPVAATIWTDTVASSTGGMYPSLALDSSGNPSIGYQASSHLTYASWNGSGWDVQTVDPTSFTGAWTSLALDSSGSPRISYSYVLTPALRYAAWNGTAWENQTVDKGGLYTSLALDSSDRPHISYSNSTTVSARTLKYASWNGTAWENQTVDATGNVYYTSLALNSAGYPRIAYIDASITALKYAAWNGTGWDVQTVDNASTATFVSLKLDSAGNPRIAYANYSTLYPKYAEWNGSGWTTGIIESTSGCYYLSLALDSVDNPRISYSVSPVAAYVLKYAALNGETWDTETLNSTDGRYTSLAMDREDYPRIAYYGSSTLRYASGTPSVPTVSGITPSTGENTATVSITDLSGSGFYGTPEVHLTKSGKSNISATSVALVNSSHLTLDLPITGAATGEWDVIVVNPDGQEGTNASVTFNVTSSTCPATVTLDPGDSIADGVSSVCNGGTVVLNPGTYSEYNITLSKNVTIRAASGYTAADTIIDGMQGGKPIVKIASGKTVALSGLTFKNGTASEGGAIFNSGGTLTIASSVFTGCSATYGGAIENVAGTINAITGSTFQRCTATYGGAIRNCNSGGVDEGIITTVKFCRIYNNTADYGPAILNEGTATIDAENNWWGTNSDPSGYVSGNVTISPWLVLGATSSSSSIATGGSATVRANLTYNSGGSDTSADGYLPDEIPVAWTFSGVYGSLKPVEGATASGANSTVFSPTSEGPALVNTTVDGETVSVPFTVSGSVTTAPTTVPVTTATTAVATTTSSDDSGETARDTSYVATAPGAGTGGTMTFAVNEPLSAGSTVYPYAIIAVSIVPTETLGSTELVVADAGSTSHVPDGRTVAGIAVISPVAVNPSAIGSGTITFAVSSDWLSEHGLAPANIVLMRFHDGTWAELPTTYQYQSGNAYYFTATTPGFSYFAVANRISTASTDVTVAETAVTPVLASSTQEADVTAAAPASAKAASAGTSAPVTTPTTAAPVSSDGSSGIPVLTVLAGMGGIAVVAVGAVLTRRWWIRRQNPALFRKYD